MKSSETYLRIPPWLRIKLPQGRDYNCTGKLLKDLNLNTVCQSAKCPNIYECFSSKVATFLILGNVCTRNCAFCNITPGKTLPPDPTEPERVSEAVGRLELKHVVITSVTRDDLPDGGAGHYAAVMNRIRADHPGLTLEVLIPDFRGDENALRAVLAARPDVLNHNVETAGDLYSAIRPQADYGQSLELLRRSKNIAPEILTKSGLMVGLGETDEQVKTVVEDLAEVGCDIVTIGQYMRPSVKHPPVERYVHPDVFAEYAEFGKSLGVPNMFSEPLVRSSYNAAMFAGGCGRKCTDAE